MKCKCQNEMTCVYSRAQDYVYQCKHCGLVYSHQTENYLGHGNSDIWHEPHFTVDVKTEYKVKVND